jgi:hypothetical protein
MRLVAMFLSNITSTSKSDKNKVQGEFSNIMRNGGNLSKKESGSKIDALTRNTRAALVKR